MKTKTSKKSLGGKPSEEEALLTSVAESIGSTMGRIVGSANAAQKAMTPSHRIRTVKRQGRRLVRKRKKA